MGSSAAIQFDHKSGTSQAFRLCALNRPAPLYTTNTVWSAFQDGMDILNRYAGRSGANSTLIAKENLRLLHDTLLADPSYRERLTTAENEAPENGSALYNLFNSQGFCADLITLEPGCYIHISNNDLYSQMYMLIDGEASIINATSLHEANNQPARHLSTQHKSWWNRLRHSSNKNICKQRDVILIGHNGQVEKTLSALEHHCMLLKISLPIPHQKSENYSLATLY